MIIGKSMRTFSTIFWSSLLLLSPFTIIGQTKPITGKYHSTGYYSGVTITFNSNNTFTLRSWGHISTDTAAGIYKLDGTILSLEYTYNNYDSIFASYKSRNEPIPSDIQLAASRVILRPINLEKKRSRLYVIDEKTGQRKRFSNKGKTTFVYLRKIN